MASSRVMPSSSQPQAAAGSADLGRFRSGSGIGSMNMDDIMRNIYGDAPPPAAGGPAEPSPLAVAPAAAARRTSEEVWKEISAAGGGGVLTAPAPPPPPAAAAATGARGGAGGAAEMTLEDFLARDTGGAAMAPVVEASMALGFPDGGDVTPVGGGGRVRKRAPMDPMDRAVVQRQKRMIKNRESAARSRDRKQAYVAELESQVSQLEEEQAELLREQEEQNQKRLKELMEKAVPVIRRKPLQDLRRTNSMEW
ncbi:hypothetical protein EJB05_35715 [Eragrostis curvula]|uniref:BZIP domain-containing protein n=1 Tax=Eragrostis curvula TaxID=38414 RepID=A0A5J9U774_9POAL|nr:hypothetical protein EJB05_35715 [Eragrostis curvula]